MCGVQPFLATGWADNPRQHEGMRLFCGVLASSLPFFRVLLPPSRVPNGQWPMGTFMAIYREADTLGERRKRERPNVIVCVPVVCS